MEAAQIKLDIYQGRQFKMFWRNGEEMLRSREKNQNIQIIVSNLVHKNTLSLRHGIMQYRNPS